MLSPAAAATSSHEPARSALVAGAKHVKHGMHATRDRSTTSRRYSGVPALATEAAISSPAVHLAVTFEPRSDSDGCEAQSDRPLAAVAEALGLALLFCSLAQDGPFTRALRLWLHAASSAGCPTGLASGCGPGRVA